MTWMRRQLAKDEGFTLIELMVVVLIIAILIAIAIPTFLGARERAQDRAAQSNIRNALTAAKVFYVDNENFNATAAQLTAIEPSLDFTDDTLSNGVEFAVEDVSATSVDQMVTIWSISESGTVFCLTDIAASGSANAALTAGTHQGQAATVEAVNTAAECVPLADW